MEEIVIKAGAILNFVCEVIVLALPWMILAAIKSVKKSIDDASAQRTYEAGKLLEAIGILHDDLTSENDG